MIARNTLNRITGKRTFWLDGQRVSRLDFAWAFAVRHGTAPQQIVHRGDTDTTITTLSTLFGA